MEIFQELVFTISFSLIVSLLIAKLFSVASSCEDVTSPSIIIQEKEWVVYDSEKHDLVNLEDDLGSGVAIDDFKNVGGVDACQLFDETSHRAEIVKSDDLGSGVAIDDFKNVGGVDACQLFDETSHRAETVKSDDDESDAVGSVLGVDLGQELAAPTAREPDFDDDDDWQGIETTDLEKTFGAAVAFMASKISADRLNLVDNDVKIQLYGLHKVANEGSCYEPQPMALKVAARANWNAWKRLENLGRDDAMEQYIDLLSRHVPDWMGSHAYDKQ